VAEAAELARHEVLGGAHPRELQVAARQALGGRRLLLEVLPFAQHRARGLRQLESGGREVYLAADHFVQRQPHAVGDLAQLHGSGGLGHVQGARGPAHAAGLLQRKKQAQLPEAHIHRFFSICSDEQIDFTERPDLPSIGSNLERP
jgi:hypothetical protein